MKEFIGILLGIGKKAKKKEVQEAIFIINEMAIHFNSVPKMLFDAIKYNLNNNKKSLEFLKKAPSIKQWVMSTIANMAGDLLETGEYHIWRGVLNPAGPGPALLKMYEYCLDELVNMGTLAEEEAKQEINKLMKNISTIG